MGLVSVVSKGLVSQPSEDVAVDVAAGAGGFAAAAFPEFGWCSGYHASWKDASWKEALQGGALLWGGIHSSAVGHTTVGVANGVTQNVCVGNPVVHLSGVGNGYCVGVGVGVAALGLAPSG